MKVTWILYRPGELLQKPHIILGIQAQVVDAVFELADAFDAHAECKAGVFVAVDAKILQHFRMHHAAAQDLHPAGMFADAAAAAAADAAIDVHFRAGLGERKIRRPETHPSHPLPNISCTKK